MAAFIKVLPVLTSTRSENYSSATALYVRRDWLKTPQYIYLWYGFNDISWASCFLGAGITSTARNITEKDLFSPWSIYTAAALCFAILLSTTKYQALAWASIKFCPGSASSH